MNRTKLIAIAAACALAISAFPMLVHGDDPQTEAVYDSAADPLISLSYVTEVLPPAYDAKINAQTDSVSALQKSVTAAQSENTALRSELAAAKKQISSLETRLSSVKSEKDALAKQVETMQEELTPDIYQVVYLRRGTKLMSASPMEIILRSGIANVVSGASNGVNDISTGTELMNASLVPLFHCLLVLRGDDGRGIQVTSEDAYVMVRGDYKMAR